MQLELLLLPWARVVQPGACLLMSIELKSMRVYLRRWRRSTTSTNAGCLLCNPALFSRSVGRLGRQLLTRPESFEIVHLQHACPAANGPNRLLQLISKQIVVLAIRIGRRMKNITGGVQWQTFPADGGQASA